MRLFLCEKPSQAKDIAKVLGASRRGDGCWVGTGVTVTWCIGHLLETAPPDAYDARYKRWVLADLPIVPSQWKMQVKPKTASQYKAVKRLLGEAAELVIATDADREGEMIARELVEHCRYRGPIRRLWLSALDDASIRKALASLKPGAETFSLYHSALGRSRADWLIGMNMSRLFTLLGRQSGYQGVLPVGRVQTPTLRLVVDRDRSIADFVPVPYWAIDVQLDSAGTRFHAQWRAPEDACDDQGRCLKQELAQLAAAAINGAGSAQVVAIKTERVRETAPLPFDLGTLQEVCSKKLGLGAQETLDIAQALYETHKVITYPRSDCGYLPLSQHSEAPAILGALGRADPTLAPLQALPGTATSLAGMERRQGQRPPRHHPYRGGCRSQSPGGQVQGRLHPDSCPLPGAVPAQPRIRPHPGRLRLRRPGAACGRQADCRAGLAPCAARGPDPAQGSRGAGAAGVAGPGQGAMVRGARNQPERPLDPAAQALHRRRPDQGDEERRQVGG